MDQLKTQLEEKGIVVKENKGFINGYASACRI